MQVETPINRFLATRLVVSSAGQVMLARGSCPSPELAARSGQPSRQPAPPSGYCALHRFRPARCRARAQSIVTVVQHTFLGRERDASAVAGAHDVRAAASCRCARTFTVAGVVVRAAAVTTIPRRGSEAGYLSPPQQWCRPKVRSAAPAIRIVRSA